MTLLLTLAPPLITAITIVGVGYWVNTTIRRKTQRDTVLVNYLLEQQRKINELIDSALSARELEACTLDLRSLSNEIHHVYELSNFFALCQTQSEERINRLNSLVVEFKHHLTASGEVAEEEPRERARQTGNRLRKLVLETHFALCKSKKNRLGE